MKSNKGFSLIEMLGVVIVLAILTLLIAPVVTKVMDDNRNKIYDEQVEIIISAAKIWGSDHIGRLPSEGENGIYVTIGELKNGYLKSDIRNPKTDFAFSDNDKVYITNDNGVLNYEFQEGE